MDLRRGVSRLRKVRERANDLDTWPEHVCGIPV